MSINTRNKLAGVFMTLVMALGVGVVAPQPASAWPSHDASITNTGAYSFTVCHHWTGKTCKTGSAHKKMLRPGKNSRKEFKWQDTDGLCVPRGYALVGASWAKNGACIKISGLDGDQKYSVRKLVNGR